MFLQSLENENDQVTGATFETIADFSPLLAEGIVSFGFTACLGGLMTSLALAIFSYCSLSVRKQEKPKKP